jgi:hypothetical protein
VSYRGGSEFWYRLRIGDFPCATTSLPLAIKRGNKAMIGFAGPNVDGVSPVEVTAPTDPAVNALWVAPVGANGLHGWPVSVALSDLDESLEGEPNNEPAKANRVNVPSAITGRLLQKGDIDYFVFAAKKGQRVIIEAHTRDLNSPAEVYMVLRDAKGGQLQASNPTVAPRLDFTAPADGDYTISGLTSQVWRCWSNWTALAYRRAGWFRFPSTPPATTTRAQSRLASKAGACPARPRYPPVSRHNRSSRPLNYS